MAQTDVFYVPETLVSLFQGFSPSPSLTPGRDHSVGKAPWRLGRGGAVGAAASLASTYWMAAAPTPRPSCDNHRCARTQPQTWSLRLLMELLLLSCWSRHRTLSLGLERYCCPGLGSQSASAWGPGHSPSPIQSPQTRPTGLGRSQEGTDTIASYGREKLLSHLPYLKRIR